MHNLCKKEHFFLIRISTNNIFEGDGMEKKEIRINKIWRKMQISLTNNIILHLMFEK